MFYNVVMIIDLAICLVLFVPTESLPQVTFFA